MALNNLVVENWEGKGEREYYLKNTEKLKHWMKENTAILNWIINLVFVETHRAHHFREGSTMWKQKDSPLHFFQLDGLTNSSAYDLTLL